jgi:uncharacterized low-complexity protein
MKKIIALAAVAAITIPFSAMAGSEIKKSTIVNQAKINQSANIAVGTASEANMGSIKIAGSKVKESTVVNQANVNQSANIAVGTKSEANMGSIKVE